MLAFCCSAARIES